jgi:hypothetical protein
MNALLTFLAARNESLSAFAVRIGRSPSTLSRVLDGRRNPSVGLARDVEAGTEGHVTAALFLEICMATKASSSAAAPAMEAAE